MPGVKAADTLPAVSEIGNVGDAANVGNQPALGVTEKGRSVKCRRQRRALATGGHIPAAKIGDGGDAGAAGDQVGVANLQSERMTDCARRLVPNGLPVAADRGHLLSAGAGLLQKLQGGLGKGQSQLVVQLAETVDFVTAGLAEGEDVASQLGGVFHFQVADKLRLLAAPLHQCGVYTIRAGAGHQPDIALCHRSVLAGTGQQHPLVMAVQRRQ